MEEASTGEVSPQPPLALSSSERSEVLTLLHEDRFMDKAPRELYATLLDEERYLCSIRTMYLILEREGEVKERRHQPIYPHYAKPEYSLPARIRCGVGI